MLKISPAGSGDSGGVNPSACITRACAAMATARDAPAVALLLRDLYDELLALGADDAAEGVAALEIDLLTNQRAGRDVPAALQRLL